MSFVDRIYPDIVRDVLTNLTQGVTRELHRVSYKPLARPLQVPDIVLLRRPVKRVSVVSGFIEPPQPSDPLVRYTFSLNDYELVADPSDPTDVSRIRFLPFGKKPATDTDVTVNYYPRSTDPTPLTDLNVGSVTRTLLEAVSKEMALLYAQLNLVYDSAFVETATGASLERVVALLGYQRFRAGRPTGSVTFTRRAGAIGSITIPAGTPITDSADKIRYETIETRALLAGEATAQIAVRGSSDITPVVETGVLTIIQRAIAGLDTVTNERPTTRSSDDETDEQLRARARDALLASNKGTVSAIEHGLLQLPEVRSVKIVEMPNGVPGEIKLSIDLAQPNAAGDLPLAVLNRIEELRPAGIRVVRDSAGSIALQAKLQLTLARSNMAPADIAQIHKTAQSTLVAEIRKKGVGEKIRNRALTAAVLRDERIVDAVITFSVKDGAVGDAGADFEPDAASSVQLLDSDVSFATDSFDKALAAGDTIPVEVRAALTVQLLAGVALVDVKTEIQTRLNAFFENLKTGSVDSNALLTALRNDSRYAIDPLKLQITLSTVDQFVLIAQGGAVFTVLPQQVFSIASVEVNT
ncbi:MAG: hypothetical protein JWM78_2119 [Verrucomicrobiaceae bacterium]|nr:hypothetical protein [Verrucomicrobiaceae bacterium]